MPELRKKAKIWNAEGIFKEEMNKKDLSERDICTKYITSALEKAGWDPATQFLEEFPLKKELMQALGGGK